MIKEIKMKKIFKILLFSFLLADFLNAKEINYNNLFKKYGEFYGVNPVILWGIAKTESNFDPNALNINKNGTLDIGLMQINSIHYLKLKKFNYTLFDLYDPEINVAFGSYVLSRCLKKHGLNLRGINCYNGRTRNNPYSKKVLRNILKAIEKATKS